ncbi:hypothetical protein [Pseudonocardia sp.]|uniref:hypothetical protein n=1 Tax=Pseudonocardia sp. TaxID=60912 RepID=UPI00262D96BD|nr:hypothetical protein [Pseudonocardia sp.]
MSVAVQVAGIVPVRLDLNHLGAPEQQLGMSLGTVLVYLRTAGTARTVAEGWGRAAVLARSLSVAVAGRRPLVVVGPSTIAAIVQLAGVPQVTAEYEPSRADGAAAMLRIQVGPVEWQVRDANAYTSMLRAWRQAARLLGENPTEYE